MTVKTRIKICVDVLMSLALLFLMCYQFFEQLYHEIAGAAMLILLITHHILNIKWYSSLGKGKYSSGRILKLIGDWLLIIAMLLLMISGIAMSRYVFSFIGLPISQELARNIHMTTSYSCYLLIGFHLGLHWSMFLSMFRKALHPKKLSKFLVWLLRCLAFAISAYGIYAIIKRDIFSYITLKMHFIMFDASEPIPYYILDLLSITVLTVFIGYYLQKLLNHKFLVKEKGALK